MARVKQSELKDTTVSDLVSDAIGELTALGEEFREICDNTPDSLQSTSVYESRDSTASTLEGLQEPDIDEALGALPAKFAPWQPARKGRSLSRADRCAEACARLETAVEVLQEIVDGAAEDNKEDETRRDVAQSLIEEIEEIKSEAEGCEFPGMYG